MRRAPRDSIEATLTIESIGVRGDGVAHRDGEAIYIPFAAPGDRVRVRLGVRRGEGRVGDLVELLSPGARVSPVCPHFGGCGGCALQHLDDGAYRRAKESQIVTALVRQGVPLPPTMAPLLRLPPQTRRRARFSIRANRAPAASVVGFNARASHEIVDMRSCAVLAPPLLALVAPLRDAIATVAPAGEVAAIATLSDSGIDLLLEVPAPPALAGLEALARFAEAQDLGRLSWRIGAAETATPLAIRRTPRVIFSGVPVEPPVEAFLQASIEAERVLVAEVLAGVGAAERVLDLYAGVGTFSFALAQKSAVHAVEGSPPAVAALAAAARGAALARISSEVRDLARRPLLPEELARFAAVVFDPPRAGAAAQCAMLARSRAPRIVAVSCNPASFARDAAILVAGGYRLVDIKPIDQFVWSPHVELVARFVRPS
jgi:23S rRNA (uracil1939-C5)-methyltransferase